jgi:TolA-binding protein
MFTKRHENELAEIKALTHELSHRFQEILAQLERIEETQDQLLRDDQPKGKKARARQPAQAVSDSGTKAGRRQGKQPGNRREATTPAASTEGPSDGVPAGKRQGGAGRKRRKREPTPSRGSDEE